MTLAADLSPNISMIDFRALNLDLFLTVFNDFAESLFVRSRSRFMNLFSLLSSFSSDSKRRLKKLIKLYSAVAHVSTIYWSRLAMKILVVCDFSALLASVSICSSKVRCFLFSRSACRLNRLKYSLALILPSDMAFFW